MPLGAPGRLAAGAGDPPPVGLAEVGGAEEPVGIQDRSAWLGGGLPAGGELERSSPHRALDRGEFQPGGVVNDGDVFPVFQRAGWPISASGGRGILSAFPVLALADGSRSPGRGTAHWGKQELSGDLQVGKSQVSSFQPGSGLQDGLPAPMRARAPSTARRRRLVVLVTSSGCHSPRETGRFTAGRTSWNPPADGWKTRSSIACNGLPLGALDVAQVLAHRSNGVARALGDIRGEGVGGPGTLLGAQLPANGPPPTPPM